MKKKSSKTSSSHEIEASSIANEKSKRKSMRGKSDDQYTRRTATRNDSMETTNCYGFMSTAKEPSTIQSFLKLFSLPAKNVTMLSIIVLVPAVSQEIMNVCDDVAYCLASRGIIVSIHPFQDTNFSSIVNSGFCDLILLSNEMLKMVSMAYPDIHCSSVTVEAINSEEGVEDLFTSMITSICDYAKKTYTLPKPKYFPNLNKLSSLLIPSFTN